jgi:asparagine synthase (glutamine-hydrolysing)
MCGISVEYSPSGLKLEESTRIVEKQLDIMKSRGPDASILKRIGSNIVMGHNRLAIIGLEEESNQPFSYKDSFHIVFNGEIYNYKQIKNDLIKKGELFRTSSDTEVILLGYKVYGLDIFEKLRGMFSIIIYDKDEKKLIVSRDTFGIKPLYFYESKDGKYSFSSSVRAIKSSINQDFQLNSKSKILFDWFGHIPEPNTVYDNIFAIEPGVNYIFSNNGVQKKDREDKLSNIYNSNNVLLDKNFSSINLNEALSESVGAHLVADVPLSLFLSSGIDSNLVAHYANKNYKKPLFAQTLAIKSLYNTRFDESELASITARKLGLQIKIKTADIEYIKKCSEEVLDFMDQPSVDGLNVYMLSKELELNNLKVSLVGTGADELLCGYSFYNSMPLIAAAKRNSIFKFISKRMNRKFSSSKFKKLFDTVLPYKDILDSYILQRSLNAPISLIEEYNLNEIKDAYEYVREIIGSEIVESKLSLRTKLMYFDQTFYLKNQLLRDCDWASMANSIEIRTPFVDKKLLKLILFLDVNKKKKVKKHLAKSELAYISSSFHKRKKTGFAIPTSLNDFNQKQYTQSLIDKQKSIYANF